MSETPHTETTPLLRFSESPQSSQKSQSDGDHGARNETIWTKEEKQQIKQLGQMWVMCEAQRQMHRLAHLYFSYRLKWYNTVPLTLITMTSGLMAFLATSEMIPETSKNFLSLIVGVLAIISTGVQTLNQEARFDSKAEMHKNAALGLKKITDDINFVLVNPLNFKLSSQQSHSDKEKTGSLVTDTDDQKTPASNETKRVTPENLSSTVMGLYEQISDSCQSQIPVKISQTFLMADSRLEISLTEKDKKIISGAHGHLGKQIIHRCLYNEVFCKITSYSAFPKKCPNPEDIVKESMEQVGKCFQKPLIQFSQKGEKKDQEEDKKGGYCCIV